MNCYKYFCPILFLFLCACDSLPASGPNHKRILELSQNQDLSNQVNIVDVNEFVIQNIMRNKNEQKFSTIKNTGSYNGRIAVGDGIAIRIWEAPPAVLFGGAFGANGTGTSGSVELPVQTVDAAGIIKVPYVGDIKIIGKTPRQVQNFIVSSLSGKANQPQALVQIVENKAQTVTIIRQGSSKKMPLSVNKERILDAIASVGGAIAETNEMAVQLTRGNEVKKMSLETLIADPKENILLNPGDVITLLHNPYSFTGMGAIRSTKEIRFSTKGINLAEAIAQMGGLLDNRSDPRGVFIFRQIPFNKLNKDEQNLWKTRGYTDGLDIPTVYRIDLLNPRTLFFIQKFPVEDKDVIYVSNAPLAEFQKFVSMVFSITNQSIGTADKLNNF